VLEPLELLVVFAGVTADADFFPPECRGGGGVSDADSTCVHLAVAVEEHALLDE
jgi:hypothetical protein